MAKTVAMAEASGPWWVRWALTGTGGVPREPGMNRWPPYRTATASVARAEPAAQALRAIRPG